MAASIDLPVTDGILAQTVFDARTRYCAGAGSQLTAENPHALDCGFWGRPNDVKLREKAKSSASKPTMFDNSAPVVFCPWCIGHFNIDCTLVDVPALLAKGEDALDASMPRGLFNHDFTGLSYSLRCASLDVYADATRLTRGDFVIRIVRSSAAAAAPNQTSLPVVALFRNLDDERANPVGDGVVCHTDRSKTPSSSSSSPSLSDHTLSDEEEKTQRSSSSLASTPSTDKSGTFDAQFVIPTCTEFEIEISHSPTFDSNFEAAKRQRLIDVQGVVQLQSAPPSARPCFVVERLVVGGKEVRTTWKGETLFCTSGKVKFSGYDWEATNAGSFLFKADADALDSVLGIEVVVRTATWLPPVKTTLAHMSVHAALRQGAGESAAVSSGGSLGFAGGRGGGGANNATAELAVRLGQYRMLKQQGLRPDKDQGAGQRLVACGNLMASVGKTFSLDPLAVDQPVDGGAASSSSSSRHAGQHTFTVGLRCVQTADAVRKDNARVVLHDSGLDFWTHRQKQARKRIRATEKQLIEQQQDLTDINKEVESLAVQHADLVRLFTPKQLDDSVALMSTEETPEVCARLSQLEQARFNATSMHYEV